MKRETERGAEGKAKRGNEKEAGKEGGRESASVRLLIAASVVLCMCAPDYPGCHETRRQGWCPPDTKVC